MRSLLVILLLALSAFAEVNDTDISVAFENSNLTNIVDGGVNIIDADVEDKTAYTAASAWYCFKITGNYADQTVTFNIGNYDYLGAWKPVYSYDGGETWIRGAAGSVTGTTLTFSIAFVNKGSEVLVCLDYYINYTDFNSWVAGLSGNDVKTFVFGSSVGSRNLWSITLTDPDVDDSRKKTILLISGQHPYETCATYTLKYLVQYLLTDTPYTNELRRRYKWVILPCLNPDGIYSGLGRPNANAMDLNREWEEGDRDEPEIAAAWAYINKIYPEPSIMQDYHGLGGGFAYYQIVARLLTHKTYNRLTSLKRHITAKTPWTMLDDATGNTTAGGSLSIYNEWTAVTVETSMLTSPQTMVELADNAKNLVASFDQYLIGS